MGGRESYDCRLAEARLCAAVFGGTPSVTQETRLMEWSDALPAAGGGALPALRSKVGQVELPPEAVASLHAELLSGRSADAIARCAQTVDTARLFLGKVSYSLAHLLPEQGE